MEKILMCDINMFDNTQKLYLIEDGKKHFLIDTNISNISNYIIGTCSEYGLKKVHFFGNENYLQKIIQNTKTLENKMYGHNIIEIEVN